MRVCVHVHVYLKMNVVCMWKGWKSTYPINSSLFGPGVTRKYNNFIHDVGSEDGPYTTPQLLHTYIHTVHRHVCAFVWMHECMNTVFNTYSCVYRIDIAPLDCYAPPQQQQYCSTCACTSAPTWVCVTLCVCVCVCVCVCTVGGWVLAH